MSRRLGRIGAVFVLLFLTSTIGYMLIERLSFLDAAYMTIITLSTVGFGEVQSLSPLGRAFTMTVILVGVGMVAFLYSVLAEYVIAGHLGGTMKKRRIMRTIKNLQDHYVICGYGRVGEFVARELNDAGVLFVVVDRDPDAIQRCEECGFLLVAGDATDDDVLRQAGLERARGLVAALNSDADNVFVVLGARFMNPDLTIVARSTTEDAERKLRAAGADRVISPYRMAAHRIARQLTRPNVISFLELALGNELEFFLEEIRIAPDSNLVGHTMGEAGLRERTGANVLSVVRRGEGRLTDWSPALQLRVGDIMIALGNREQLQALAKLTGDPGISWNG